MEDKYITPESRIRLFQTQDVIMASTGTDLNQDLVTDENELEIV